jgi:hypothetical protein
VRLILILVVFLVFFSCKKQEKYYSPNIPNEDYTGLKIGNISFYNVLYILHDDQVDRHDTIKFKLKSIIEDTFRDNANNLRFKIHRFRWNDTIASWVNYKMFSAFVSKNYYIESEDNFLVKKLSIPYKIDFSWNSDSYNINDTLHFRFKTLYPKFKINNFEVDSVIHVKQQYYSTYVDLKRKDEFYSKNKGLVLKTYKDLKIKKGDTTKIDRGEELYYFMYQFTKGI